jgi:hypothetical protein
MFRSFLLTPIVVVCLACPPAVAQESGAAKARAALDQTGSIEFSHLSMEQAAARLERQLGVPVVVHESLRPLLEVRRHVLSSPSALEQAPPAPGPARGMVVQVAHPPGFSCRMENQRLGTALRMFLEHYGLGYAVVDGIVVIATAEKADALGRTQRLNIAFQKTLLAEAAAELGRRSGFDVLLDAKVNRDDKTARDAMVTLTLRHVTLDDAVRLVAESADLDAAPMSSGWIITTRARSKGWQARHDEQLAELRKQWVEVPVPDSSGPNVALAEGVPPMDLAQNFGLQPNFGFQPQLGGVTTVKVPKALLRTAGPAPRLAQLAGAAKDQAVPLQPAPREPRKSATAETLKKLSQPWDVNFEAPTTFRDMLETWEKRGMPRVIIYQQAFKLENPDAPDVYETQIVLPRVQGLPAGRVFRMALDQIPTADATYLVQAGHLLVTTSRDASPRARFVQASFANRPLDEALEELSDLTGVAIAVDPRVGGKGKTPVTARFPSETNLAQIVRVLADMADLKAVVVDAMIYVTSRDNDVSFPEEASGPGKWTRPDEFAGLFGQNAK